MQSTRLFEIIYILLDKEKVTAKELADRLEVSTRTIYRDIDLLSVAGIPVYMQKGKGGGIFLLPGFTLDKTLLTKDEKFNIISSLQALNALSPNDDQRSFEKLQSTLGIEDADWVEVNFTSWYNPQNEKQLFNKIKNAILKKQVLGIQYQSTKGEYTKREVYPYRLVFRGHAWYLFAYCTLRNSNRYFKLSRIDSLKVLPETFKREKPAAESEPLYIKDEKFVELVLRISPTMAYRVHDEFKEYEKQSDGSYVAKIIYPDNEYLYAYISSFGPECEVLEPDYVRSTFVDIAKKVLNIYE